MRYPLMRSFVHFCFCSWWARHSGRRDRNGRRPTPAQRQTRPIEAVPSPEAFIFMFMLMYLGLVCFTATGPRIWISYTALPYRLFVLPKSNPDLVSPCPYTATDHDFQVTRGRCYWANPGSLQPPQPIFSIPRRCWETGWRVGGSTEEVVVDMEAAATGGAAAGVAEEEVVRRCWRCWKMMICFRFCFRGFRFHQLIRDCAFDFINWWFAKSMEAAVVVCEIGGDGGDGGLRNQRKRVCQIPGSMSVKMNQ
ncbi:hypothetical protein Droror1_Dr00013772 [Drosera rotundifolia]